MTQDMWQSPQKRSSVIRLDISDDGKVWEGIEKPKVW